MSHPHMLLSVKECEEISLMKGKLTVIIETYNHNIDRLMACIFSLLLRAGSVNDVLEHIIVCIHGADERTGSTKVQDKKQAFLEELRAMKWKIPGKEETRDMPITVIRVWSRIGCGQAIDMAVPWVHTEAYAIMSDDQILRDEAWVDYIKKELFEKEEIGYLSSGGWNAGSSENPGTQNWQLHLARMDVNLAVFKKAIAEQLGVRFAGYFINHKFQLCQELCDKINVQTNHILDTEKKFGELVVESGAWAKHLLEDAGVQHNLSFGNSVKQNQNLSWHHDKEIIDGLESRIKSIPEYGELYNRYLTVSKINIIERFKDAPIDPNLKGLVCVCVYNRYREIINWLRAWKNCNKYNCKLAVVQVWGALATNNECGDVPDEILAKCIQKMQPDYYLPVFNHGMDIRALHDLPTDERLKDYDWNTLFWFTDDCLPMNQDFLRPFLATITPPEVGMTAAFPESGYMRTVAFGLKRDVMGKIKWIADGNITGREQCLQQENQLSLAVQRAGFKVASPSPTPEDTDYIHWSRFTDWVWDADSTQTLDMWANFEQQFEVKDRLSNSLEGLSPSRLFYGREKHRRLGENIYFTEDYILSVLKKNGII